MYEGLGKMVDALVWAIGLMIPFAILGIWKFVEILIWFFSHISFNF